jgi:hypothetical protein
MQEKQIAENVCVFAQEARADRGKHTAPPL